MKTILGEKTHDNGFSIFHVWGNLSGEEISIFYATKNIKCLISKYRKNKSVFIDPASTNLKQEYVII